MRHLITEPTDAYDSCEPTQEDWDDYRDYLDSLRWEEDLAMALEEVNCEIAAIDSAE